MIVALDTPFVEMPLRHVEAVVQWCQSHDWGCGAYFDGSHIGDLEDWQAPVVGPLTMTVARFDTWRAIRNWAGY